MAGYFPIQKVITIVNEKIYLKKIQGEIYSVQSNFHYNPFNFKSSKCFTASAIGATPLLCSGLHPRQQIVYAVGSHG